MASNNQTADKKNPLPRIEDELKGIITSLKNNPIFRMSLGSKELFHSNFLEYLWYLNRDSFIEMINALPTNQCKVNVKLDPQKPNDYYIFGREEKNFDICIYHGNKVYDLVIENKVKSIPYKEQLKDYQDKTKQTRDQCRFILLTLSQDFPDKDDQEINEWDTIGYADLLTQIESCYFNKMKENNPNYYYIKDYLGFVKSLCNLKDYILPDQQHLLTQQLFDNDSIAALKTIRLHDMYIKLRCSWFAMKLKEVLHGEAQVQVVHTYSDIKPGYVNLNVAINQGNGQIAAWICNEDTDKATLNEKERKLKNSFEIVIQGNQYRHGINQSRFLLDIENKYDRLNQHYSRLSTLPDSRASQFLNNWSNMLRPSDRDMPIRFQKIKIEKSGPFNCYGESYIYRYEEIHDTDTIKNLLYRMKEDIMAIIDNLPSLS